MQKFYPLADVTSLGAVVGCYCYLEEEAASTVTHEATEDLPTEAMPKALSTEDDTITDRTSTITTNPQIKSSRAQGRFYWNGSLILWYKDSSLQR
ncbi:hypothetical protein BDA96_06G029100 [Sorghum bicolor]|uniref:Uncharacterized protein n=2 Tax=Sorghum bicolor TaxID=4558 RepID=A0A921UC48_SORBI|nr:hypothetical protein BDA96_06G029100 [Sorghum bicolor]OQU81209.1 hypothetical protein SORBI_3006G027601 [Sorghum bicolor]